MATKNNGEVTGWTGWVAFAGLMLFIVGILHAISGFVALFKDTNIYTASGNLWVLNYTQWGWIHIFGGILAIWAASSLLQGKAFGRIVATILAIGSLIANFAFIPIYPFWSILIIVIDILIIWAVTVHGGEMKELN